MPYSLRELIDQVIALKQGDKEFMLHHLESVEDRWAAMIGAGPGFGLIGQVPPDFETKGSTPEEAVQRLIEAVSSGQ